jgi:hypothetical protein
MNDTTLAPARTDAELPPGLKDATDKVRSLRDKCESITVSKDRAAFYKQFVAPLEKHCVRLMNGTPAPEYDGNAMIGLERGRRVNHPQQRAELLAEITAALENGSYDPQSPNFVMVQFAPGTRDIVESLCACDGGKMLSLLAGSRWELAKYAATNFDKFPLANPTARKEEILQALRGQNTPEDVARLHSELQIVQGEGGAAIASATRSALIGAFQPVQAALDHLLHEAIEQVTARREDVLENERLFFADAKVPREFTGVGKQHDSFLRELKHAFAPNDGGGMLPTHGGAPDPQNTVLSTLFGVALV